jgi:hypothetical protein
VLATSCPKTAQNSNLFRNEGIKEGFLHAVFESEGENKRSVSRSIYPAKQDFVLLVELVVSNK